MKPLIVLLLTAINVFAFAESKPMQRMSAFQFSDVDQAIVAWNMADGICRDEYADKNSNEKGNQTFSAWLDKHGQDGNSEIAKAKDNHKSAFVNLCQDQLSTCLSSSYGMFSSYPWKKDKWCEATFESMIKAKEDTDNMAQSQNNCTYSLAQKILTILKEKNYGRASNPAAVSTSSARCFDASQVAIAIPKNRLLPNSMKSDPDFIDLDSWAFHKDEHNLIEDIYNHKYKIINKDVSNTDLNVGNFNGTND